MKQETAATATAARTTETGRIDLEIPRNRQATFDPQLINKYQRRFPGFDDKIVSMYARGMSAREIVGHLRELYGIEVSPISSAPSPTRFSMRSRLAGEAAGARLSAGLLRCAAG